MDTISRRSDRKSSPLRDTKKRDLQTQWCGLGKYAAASVRAHAMWQGIQISLKRKSSVLLCGVARHQAPHPLSSIEKDDQTSDAEDQKAVGEGFAASKNEFGNFPAVSSCKRRVYRGLRRGVSNDRQAV